MNNFSTNALILQKLFTQNALKYVIVPRDVVKRTLNHRVVFDNCRMQYCFRKYFVSIEVLGHTSMQILLIQ